MVDCANRWSALRFRGAVPSAPGVGRDTSPPNGCRSATEVAIWELAENRGLTASHFTQSKAQQLLVPVWELVDSMG